MEVVSEINQMKRVLHKHRNMKKKCYCCGSGTHMLNNFEIKYMIARDQWFERTVNVQSYHKQAKEKGYEQTVNGDVDVSVSSTKKSVWSRLQNTLHGGKEVIKYRS